MKAIGLREGLNSAFRQNIVKIQVEGDSKLIIDCVRNKCSISWRLKTIIKNIRWLASQFQEIHLLIFFEKPILLQMSLQMLGTPLFRPNFGIIVFLIL